MAAGSLRTGAGGRGSDAAGGRQGGRAASQVRASGRRFLGPALLIYVLDGAVGGAELVTCAAAAVGWPASHGRPGRRRPPSKRTLLKRTRRAGTAGHGCG